MCMFGPLPNWKVTESFRDRIWWVVLRSLETCLIRGNFYVCVCMCVSRCLCMHIFKHVYIHICGNLKLMSGVLVHYSSLYSWRQVSLNPGLTNYVKFVLPVDPEIRPLPSHSYIIFKSAIYTFRTLQEMSIWIPSQLSSPSWYRQKLIATYWMFPMCGCHIKCFLCSLCVNSNYLLRGRNVSNSRIRSHTQVRLLWPTLSLDEKKPSTKCILGPLAS